MSQDNPGVLHDATNSWNGYNHQGKIALFYAVDRITELLQGAPDRKSGVDSLKNYFLEVEYTEDFSIGTIEAAEKLHYLTVHQVKDRQDKGISKYDSALQGLAVNLVRHPEVKTAYLHVTREVSHTLDTRDFLGQVRKFVLDMRWIDDQKNKLARDADRQIEKLKKKDGLSPGMIAQGIREIQAELAEELDKLEDTRNKLKDLANDDAKLGKIQMFNYGTDAGGPFYCEKEEAGKFLKRSLERFYRVYAPDKEYMCGIKYVEKSYWHMLEELNDHVVVRSRNYSNKNFKRYLRLFDVYQWLITDEIRAMDDSFYLHNIKVAFYEYLNEFCNMCRMWDRCGECQASCFKKRFRNMKVQEVEKFLHQTSPDVLVQLKDQDNLTTPDQEKEKSELNHKYLQGGHIKNPFWLGLRNIAQEPEGTPDLLTVKYKGKDKRSYLLTTLAVDADDPFSDSAINNICTEIYRNQHEKNLQLECNCLLSRGIDVASLLDRVQILEPHVLFGDRRNIISDDTVSIIPLQKFISNYMRKECEES